MALPAYTTDLILFKDFETAVTFGEFAGFTAGRGQTIDTDYPIQGNSMMSVVMNATGNAGVAVDYGSTITWTSGWCLFSWLIWLAPAAINTQANGGLVFSLGPDISNFREWNVGGSDFGSYPYGGWQNFAVDPEITASLTTGTPGTVYRWAGPGVRVISAVAKGSPLAVDVIRFGRGEFRVVAGETGNLATFAGMASTNDINTNRWGLFQAIDNGYKFKGLMILGYGGLTNFTDQNKSIVIDNTQYVQPSFNRIEIRNALSVVNWTNILIVSLSTVSKGQFEMVDNATVNLDTCTFTDLDTFIFQSNASITSSTFRRCSTVTQGGASFTGCTFDDSTVTSSIISNNPSNLNGCTFNSDGSNHAIELTSACAGNSYSLSGHTFSSYATTNGTTGNEVIYNNSGGAVTLNASGITGTVSIRNSAGSITTVVSSVPVSVGVVDVTNSPVVGAQVAIYLSSDDSQILNTDTDANGEVSVGYGGSTPAAIYVRVRKSSTGATKYIPVSSSGTITSSGYSSTITLIEDITATT